MSSKPKFIPRLPRSNSLIMGPRQSGKTTAMKLAIKELIDSGVDPSAVFYFSCDSLRDKDDLIRLLDEYRRFHSGPSYVFWTK